jgi:hypothetical protein
MSDRASRHHPMWLRLLIAIPLGAVFGVLVMIGLDDALGPWTIWVAGAVALLTTVVLARESGRIGRLLTNFLELMSGI